MRINDLLDGKDEFTIYAPGVVDILKAAAGDDPEETRPIGGYCSTERLDRQDEIVLAKGLDFSEFVQHGYFNDNHKQETSAVLGYPRLAELHENRWWTEGNLIKGYKPADEIWVLAKALKKSNAPRHLGFSIEGKVLSRGIDNRILKAKIRHVAITNSPVNVDCTWETLTKAFAAHEEVEANSLRRAVFAAHQSPAHSGGAALQSRTEAKPEITKLTFDEAVASIKKSRPKYSWAQCERFVRIMYTQPSCRS